MATLQNAPWRENRFPQFKSLPELQSWIAPLVAEEKTGQFSGKPCPKAPNALAELPKKSAGIDWVLGWLQTMCKGEIIPPLCVEIVLRDGARYFLHSILAFEDETKTICARIWDLRALGAGEIEDLKQRLNQIRSRKDLASAESVHPKLDWANLHLHYDDVAYCIEWHDRIWPQSGKSGAEHRD
jgi:hypothetical protein